MLPVSPLARARSRSVAGAKTRRVVRFTHHVGASMLNVPSAAESTCPRVIQPLAVFPWTCTGRPGAPVTVPVMGAEAPSRNVPEGIVAVTTVARLSTR